jgi:lycopene beta-cyclase
MIDSFEYDYILVGGGLQTGLLVLALQQHRPDAKLLIIERDLELGGNHTWSFHRDDLSPRMWHCVAPLVEHQWPAYQVRIRGFRRRVSLGYASISSRRFAEVIRARIDAWPGSTLLTGTTVTQVHSDHVVTDAGNRLGAAVVIDNRGPDAAMRKQFVGGYQKFWGFEIELDADWPLEDPVVMDDAADQFDGFRFFYTLPFTKRRVLVEDTRFSNESSLDRDECWRVTRRYLDRLGVGQVSIVREESGVLPMPIGGQQAAHVHLESSQPIAGGYAGGWFHPATGYSFPMAARFAQVVAETAPGNLRETLAKIANANRWRNRYGRLLNRLLFELVGPTTRYQIFRRFYRVLSEPSIARFYANRFWLRDAVRIVVGVPPRGLRPIRFARSLVAGDRPSADVSADPTGVSISAVHKVSA